VQKRISHTTCVVKSDFISILKLTVNLVYFQLMSKQKDNNSIKVCLESTCFRKAILHISLVTVSIYSRYIYTSMIIDLLSQANK